jgi:hypothetical protein
MVAGVRHSGTECRFFVRLRLGRGEGSHKRRTAAKAAVCLLIVSAASFFAGTANPKCLSDALGFASRPNQDNYNALKDPKTEAVREECWDQINREKIWPRNHPIYSSQPLLDKVLKKASNGNKWAALFVATNLRRLDGGNLEDALVALGVSMNKNPTVVLRLCRDGVIGQITLKNCVSSYPLELSDNQRGTLSYLDRRRKRILSVEARDLEDVKRAALTYLDESIRHIQGPYRPFVAEQYNPNDFKVSQVKFRHGSAVIRIIEAKRTSEKHDELPYLCRAWLDVTKSKKTVLRKYFDDIDASGFSYGLSVPEVQPPSPFFAVAPIFAMTL